MQQTQTKAMNPSPRVPKMRPEFLMAMGRVRMPMPMLPFKRWTIVSKLLQRNIEFVESYKRVLVNFLDNHF
jgi:hypothetical protein